MLKVHRLQTVILEFLDMLPDEVVIMPYFSFKTILAFSSFVFASSFSPNYEKMEADEQISGNYSRICDQQQDQPNEEFV